MLKTATAVATAFVLAGTGFAHAAGDVANGEKIFKKCQACHAVVYRGTLDRLSR